MRVGYRQLACVALVVLGVMAASSASVHAMPTCSQCPEFDPSLLPCGTFHVGEACDCLVDWFCSPACPSGWGTYCDTGTCSGGSCVPDCTPACSSDSDCNDNNACTTDTCTNPGTCSASCNNQPADASCPDAGSVSCGSPITPSNGCGTCSGTGTKDCPPSCGPGTFACGNNCCADGQTCNNGICNWPECHTCVDLGLSCGQTGSDGCGHTLTCGAPTDAGCCTSNGCEANTCIGSTCNNGCGQMVSGTKSCGCTPNGCEANTCAGSTCNNGCNANAPGTKSCGCNPNGCEANTCVGSTCNNGCGQMVAGTKFCGCTPNGCESNTCIGNTCNNGCGQMVSGTKFCGCTPNGCEANTCAGSTCNNGCNTNAQGTKFCGCTTNGCEANTCIGNTCDNGCGQNVPGTKTDGACGGSSACTTLCSSLTVIASKPSNAHYTTTACSNTAADAPCNTQSRNTGWACDSGYTKSGNTCLPGCSGACCGPACLSGGITSCTNVWCGAEGQTGLYQQNTCAATGDHRFLCSGGTWYSCGNRTQDPGYDSWTWSSRASNAQAVAGLCCDTLTQSWGSCAPTCTPESDQQFCTSLGKNCGSVTGGDNCGTSRTVNCGSCSTPGDTCGGGGTPNVCGSPALCIPANRCSNTYKYCYANNIRPPGACNQADYTYDASCTAGPNIGRCCNTDTQCAGASTGPYCCGGTCTAASCCVPNDCEANTCLGSTCNNGCNTNAPGTKTDGACCVSNGCEANTCVGSTCNNSCAANAPGTKGVCRPGDPPQWCGAGKTQTCSASCTWEACSCTSPSTYYFDNDWDGYGGATTAVFCPDDVPGVQWTTLSGDCNDNDPAINPGMSELCKNNVDDNCDGMADYDGGSTGLHGDVACPVMVSSSRAMNPSCVGPAGVVLVNCTYNTPVTSAIVTFTQGATARSCVLDHWEGSVGLFNCSTAPPFVLGTASLRCSVNPALSYQTPPDQTRTITLASPGSSCDASTGVCDAIGVCQHSVTWVGNVTDAGTGLPVEIPAVVSVDGVNYAAPGGLITVMGLRIGLHNLSATATGYDARTVLNVPFTTLPTVYNIGLTPAACHADCTFNGVCDKNCVGVNGCSPNSSYSLGVQQDITGTCEGATNTTVRKFNSTTMVRCCAGPLLPLSSIQTPLVVSTCTKNSVPLKRLVNYNGRLVEMTVVTYDKCS